MKKIVVIFLVFLLLGLSGQQGCAPQEGIQDFARSKGIIKGEAVAKLRGLTIDFEKNKPPLISVRGERLPVIWVGEKFDVGLVMRNYALKDIRADVKVFSLSKGVYGGRVIQGEDSLILESADVESGEIVPSTNLIEFGAFSYGEEFLDDTLVTEVSLYYNGLITADLCFTQEDTKECSNYRTLSENYLKGDAGFLPVSISEITKQATVRDNLATVRLFVKFRDFSNGYIKDNRLREFSASIDGVPLQCDDVVFKTSLQQTDKDVSVMCKGSVRLTDAYVYLPAEFEFDYVYGIKKSIKYKVISE